MCLNHFLRIANEGSRCSWCISVDPSHCSSSQNQVEHISKFYFVQRLHRDKFWQLFVMVSGRTIKLWLSYKLQVVFRCDYQNSFLLLIDIYTFCLIVRLRNTGKYHLTISQNMACTTAVLATTMLIRTRYLTIKAFIV